MRNALLISVRTEDTRLINRALTLASSRCPPKPGSAADAVQPTIPSRVSRYSLMFDMRVDQIALSGARSHV